MSRGCGSRTGKSLRCPDSFVLSSDEFPLTSYVHMQGMLGLCRNDGADDGLRYLDFEGIRRRTSRMDWRSVKVCPTPTPSSWILIHFCIVTARLFRQATERYNQLPASPDGHTLDIHMANIATATDSLAKPNAPILVLQNDK